MKAPLFLPARIGFVLAALAAAATTEVQAQNAAMAIYTLTFESTWSADTHPTDFPSNPHFSGLIGGTHNGAVSFWADGIAASDGIESMAETGSKVLLEDEVDRAITDGTAQFVISGGGIGVSPGSVAVTFDVTSEYPLVTVVSMVAPSPDWFVGVSGLNLMDGGAWTPQLVVPLVVYDAGTDSGTTYTSPNDDTDPPEVIAPLTDSPFDQNNVVGTFTFALQSSVANEPNPGDGRALYASPVYPNPAQGTFAVQLTLDRPQPVTAVLYDAAGREVRRTDLGWMDTHPGELTFDATGLAGHVYFLRLSTARMEVVRPVVLLK